MNVKKIQKNELGRDFVIGDLHGAAERLEQLLSHVDFNVTRDRLFSVGDLVDRGPRNEECLELINEPWFFAVRGNHEQLMSHFYMDPPGEYARWWAQNGGSWGVKYKPSGIGYSNLDAHYAEKIRKLAAQTEELPLMLTVDRQDGKKFHIIHAELSAIKPITDEDLLDDETFNDVAFRQTMDGDHIMWGRFIFYHLYAKELTDHDIQKWLRGAEMHKMGAMFNDKLSHIYSGHTIVTRPTRYKGQTNIDTGAFMSMRQDVPTWAGLTMTEPLTDKFWLAGASGVIETQPLILG